MGHRNYGVKSKSARGALAFKANRRLIVQLMFMYSRSYLRPIGATFMSAELFATRLKGSALSTLRALPK